MSLATVAFRYYVGNGKAGNTNEDNGEDGKECDFS